MYSPSFCENTNIYDGPPGTGKTERFMQILEHELETVPPERILYASFTREGARQGIRRALARFPQYNIKQFPYFRTWHSIAFHALGLTKGQVISRADYKDFSRFTGMNFAGYYMKEARSYDDKYMFLIDMLRNNKNMAAELFFNLDPFVAKYVLVQYKAYKEQMHLVDFTDMLIQFLQQHTPCPVDVGFIDEAQDMPTLQWKVAELALINCKRVYIAGDDDQAIYQWSGADVEAFLKLSGHREVLSVSHRFGEEIRKFATQVTDNIAVRIPKKYVGNGNKGTVTQVGSLAQVPWNIEGSFLVLFRNTKYIALGEEYMQSQGLLYETRDGLSVTPTDLDAIHAWNKYLKTGELTESEKLRVRSACARELKDIPKIPWQRAFVSWDFMKCEYLEKICKTYDTLAGVTPKYKLMTIHTVKGAEADNVVLYTGMSRLTYEAFESNPDAEHRVWYVGVTRARNNLFIVPSEEDENYPFFFKE